MVIEYKTNNHPSVKVDWSRQFHKSWLKPFEDLLHSEYMTLLVNYIDRLYRNREINYPCNKGDVFNAYNVKNFKDLKVVILGNEPATTCFSNGLAFGNYYSSTGPTDIHTKNIEKAVQKSYGFPGELFDSSLKEWSEQGVMLLNVSLISNKEKEMQHSVVFRHLIRETIIRINEELTDVIFVFTSKNQHYFKQFVNLDFNYILEEDGIGPNSTVFEQINEILVDTDGKGAEITWL